MTFTLGLIVGMLLGGLVVGLLAGNELRRWHALGAALDEHLGLGDALDEYDDEDDDEDDMPL